jgi:hypothetical protein
MKKLMFVVLWLGFVIAGCVAPAGDQQIGEVPQGLHFGVWRMYPDEDAQPNTFNPFPSVAPGSRWTMEDDWRTNVNLPAEQTFDDGFMWFAGNACGFNCSGEVYEPAVGINSNPTLYNSITAIDHVTIYFGFSNSTGHTVTVWMNILDQRFTGLAGPGTYLAAGTRYTDANGHAYTKDRFADPNVDGIYFGVGVEPANITPGSVAVGAIRLEITYATP